MIDPVLPGGAATASNRLSITHVETALARWQARTPTVLQSTVTPVQALTWLHERMMARRQTSIRWIDLIFVERHALSILYTRPVGNSWPGLPPP